MIPTLRKSGNSVFSVAAMNGGINENDPFTIEDNQMTDCRNLFFRDGQLRHRPGLDPFKEEEGHETEVNAAVYETGTHEEEDDAQGILSVSEQAVVQSGEYTVIAQYVAFAVTGYDHLGFGRLIGLVYKGTEVSGTISADLWSMRKELWTEKPNIVAVHESGENTVAILFSEATVRIGSDGTTSFVDDAYVPLVVEACKAVETKVRVIDGYMIDNYNLLSGAYRMSYYTDGEKIYLPTVSNGGFSGKIKGHVLIDGAYYDTEIPAGADVSSTDTLYIQKGISMKVDRQIGVVWFYSTTQSADIPLDAGTDVIELTIEDTIAKSDYEISDFRSGRWFGGDRSGMTKGTRLFLCGNAKKKNLLIWSGLNNPTYWPDHNYAYIGDQDEQITGLAQIGSVLVVFKEHSIYYINYGQSSVSVEDVTSMNVNGLQSTEAIFPVTPVHDRIGCDQPESIQLLENRLVWFYRGDVYQISSVNQFSDSNVYKVSGNIHLPRSAEKVSSCVCDDLYLLWLDGEIYALNGDSSGFRNAGRYANKETGNDMLQWFRWDFTNADEQRNGRLLMIGQDAVLIDADNRFEPGVQNAIFSVVIYKIRGEKDFAVRYNEDDQEYVADEKPIICRFMTKPFSFGTLAREKSLHSGYLLFEGEITLGAITNKQSANLGGFHSNGKGATFFKIPISRITWCQIGVTGNNLKVSGMSILYHMTGGVR